MNKIIVSFLVFCLLHTTLFAEWDRSRTSMILSKLNSGEYSEISDAITKVANDKESLPSKDSAEIQFALYKLLDSNIEVPQLEYPPNYIRLPVYQNAAYLLSLMVDHQQDWAKPNALTDFKGWYETEHAKTIESVKKIQKNRRVDKVIDNFPLGFTVAGLLILGLTTFLYFRVRIKK